MSKMRSMNPETLQIGTWMRLTRSSPMLQRLTELAISPRQSKPQSSSQEAELRPRGGETISQLPARSVDRYGRRPAACVWLSVNQKTNDDLHANWKLRDTVVFALQEMRRKIYFEMKQLGKVTKASVAMPVLPCKMLVDSENELSYDNPFDIDDPTVSLLFS